MLASSDRCGRARVPRTPPTPTRLYVDTLIGPHTVNTLPENTLEAFADHGTVARTIDADMADVDATWANLADVGVDMDDVSAQLESEGVDAFIKSFDGLIETLEAKAAELSAVTREAGLARVTGRPYRPRHVPDHL